MQQDSDLDLGRKREPKETQGVMDCRNPLGVLLEKVVDYWS
jgi:hypothetical protein